MTVDWTVTVGTAFFFSKRWCVKLSIKRFSLSGIPADRFPIFRTKWRDLCLSFSLFMAWNKFHLAYVNSLPSLGFPEG